MIKFLIFLTSTAHYLYQYSIPLKYKNIYIDNQQLQILPKLQKKYLNQIKKKKQIYINYKIIQYF